MLIQAQTRSCGNPPRQALRSPSRAEPPTRSAIGRVALSLALSFAAATCACSDDEPGAPTSSESGLSPGGSNAGASAGQAGSGPSAPSAAGGASGAASNAGSEAPPQPTGIDIGADEGNEAPSAGAGDAGAAESPVLPDAGSPPDETAFNPCPTDGSPCRIMPLGDSITDGLVGIAPGNTQGANGGYRVELFRLALANGHDITFVGTSPTTGFGGGPNGPNEVDGQPFPRDHEGISGDTVPGVAGRVDAALAATSPDIILLQIGTNHLYQGLPPEVPGQLENLIDQITNAAPDALLAVAQVTPLGASFANNGVNAYNAAVAAMVQERVEAGQHLLLVDNFSAIANDPAGVAGLVGDNIHPNVAGYALLASSWYGAIESHLP